MIVPYCSIILEKRDIYVVTWWPCWSAVAARVGVQASCPCVCGAPPSLVYPVHLQSVYSHDTCESLDWSIWPTTVYVNNTRVGTAREFKDENVLTLNSHTIVRLYSGILSRTTSICFGSFILSSFEVLLNLIQEYKEYFSHLTAYY